MLLDFEIKNCSAGNRITSNYEKNVVFNTSFVVIIRKYVVIITLVTCDTKAVSLVEQEVSCIWNECGHNANKILDATQLHKSLFLQFTNHLTDSPNLPMVMSSGSCAFLSPWDTSDLLNIWLWGLPFIEHERQWVVRRRLQNVAARRQLLRLLDVLGGRGK